MMESRDVSQLTRIALAALTRLHQQEIEAAGQAAAIVEGVSLADGWVLDLSLLTWTRDVPDDEEG